MLGTELYFGAPQGFCGELKSLRMTQEQPDERQADGNLLLALDTNILISSDLPLNFHPAAFRASTNVTPFGAVSVPA